MKRWIAIVLSAFVLFTGAADGAKALKKTVTGVSCFKTATGTLNPVWKFKPNAQATDGPFEMKYGASTGTPGSTGVCPHALVLVAIDLAGCPGAVATTQGCPNYILPSPSYVSFLMTATAAGNIKIPLNGQDILNLPGQQIAIQLFIADTQGCVPPPLGFLEVHASPLVTLYNKHSSPIYLCP